MIARSLKSDSIQSLTITGSIFNDSAIVNDHMETPSCGLKKCDTPSVMSVLLFLSFTPPPSCFFALTPLLTCSLISRCSILNDLLEEKRRLLTVYE